MENKLAFTCILNQCKHDKIFAYITNKWELCILLLSLFQKETLIELITKTYFEKKKKLEKFRCYDYFVARLIIMSSFFPLKRLTCMAITYLN